MAPLSLLLVVLSMLGGALTYNASFALPGDLLYPYKLGVNEKLQSTVAYTPESQARVHLVAIQKRLREARVLAKTGTLNSGLQAELIDNVQTHTTHITLAIDSLQSSGAKVPAALLSTQLYETLDTETQKIADASTLGSTNLQMQLAPLLTRLRTMRATAALISTKAQVASQETNTLTQKNEVIAPAADVSVASPAPTKTPTSNQFVNAAGPYF